MEIKNLIKKATELNVNLELNIFAISKAGKKFQTQKSLEGETPKSFILNQDSLWGKNFLAFSQILFISEIKVIREGLEMNIAGIGEVEIEIPMWLYRKMFFN